MKRLAVAVAKATLFSAFCAAMYGVCWLLTAHPHTAIPVVLVAVFAFIVWVVY